MKLMIKKTILLSLAIIIIASLGSCDGIIKTVKITDKWQITFVEIENLCNTRIDFLDCNLNVSLYIESKYYDSYNLWSNELWSAGPIWKIQPQSKLLFGNSTEYELDQTLIPNAGLRIDFIGTAYKGRAIDVYHIKGEGSTTVPQNKICSDLQNNGFSGDTIESCYYIDVLCMKDPTNEPIGILRINITIKSF